MQTYHEKLHGLEAYHDGRRVILNGYVSSYPEDCTVWYDVTTAEPIAAFGEGSVGACRGPMSYRAAGHEITLEMPLD